MTANPGGEGKVATLTLSSALICAAIAFPSISFDDLALILIGLSFLVAVTVAVADTVTVTVEVRERDEA